MDESHPRVHAMKEELGIPDICEMTQLAHGGRKRNSTVARNENAHPEKLNDSYLGVENVIQSFLTGWAVSDGSPHSGNFMVLDFGDKPDHKYYAFRIDIGAGSTYQNQATGSRLFGECGYPYQPRAGSKMKNRFAGGNKQAFRQFPNQMVLSQECADECKRLSARLKVIIGDIERNVKTILEAYLKAGKETDVQKAFKHAFGAKTKLKSNQLVKEFTQNYISVMRMKVQNFLDLATEIEMFNICQQEKSYAEADKIITKNPEYCMKLICGKIPQLEYAMWHGYMAQPYSKYNGKDTFFTDPENKAYFSNVLMERIYNNLQTKDDHDDIKCKAEVIQKLIRVYGDFLTKNKVANRLQNPKPVIDFFYNMEPKVDFLISMIIDSEHTEENLEKEIRMICNELSNPEYRTKKEAHILEIHDDILTLTRTDFTKEKWTTLADIKGKIMMNLLDCCQ